MSHNHELNRAISRISWNLLDTFSDILLYQISLLAAGFTASGHTSKTAHKALINADKIHHQLTEAIKPSQLKNALRYLKRKGLVNIIKDKAYEVAITTQGLQQLKSKLPVYKRNRPWDKRVYLIAYDIEEIDRDTRDKLRDFLLQIYCAQLHKSLYVSIYNPKGLLKRWLKGYVISGEVLISDIGPDGSLGEQSLEELVARAYKLDEFNQEYAAFIHEFPKSSKDNEQKKLDAAFCYHGILKRDPQLPFELLPDWWLGDKAYHRYCSIISERTDKSL